MADVRLLAELRADLAASASPWQLATFSPSNAFFSLDDDAPTGAIGAIVGEREREPHARLLRRLPFLAEYARRRRAPPKSLLRHLMYLYVTVCVCVYVRISDDFGPPRDPAQLACQPNAVYAVDAVISSPGPTIPTRSPACVRAVRRSGLRLLWPLFTTTTTN